MMRSSASRCGDCRRMNSSKLSSSVLEFHREIFLGVEDFDRVNSRGVQENIASYELGFWFGCKPGKSGCCKHRPQRGQRRSSS